MEIQTVKGEARKPAGSRAAARLRSAGKLPAVVYGHQQEPESVTVDYHEIELQLQHGAHLINLDVGGKVQSCLFKAAQYDHLGSKLIHLDLTRVDLTERVKVKVPIELRGHAKGVADGGVLRQELAEIEIECSVQEIPNSIRVVVTDVALDQVLYVKNLELPSGVTAVTDSETVVLTIHIPVEKAAILGEATEATAGSAEPEVIARGKVAETPEGD